MPLSVRGALDMAYFDSIADRFDSLKKRHIRDVFLSPMFSRTFRYETRGASREVTVVVRSDTRMEEGKQGEEISVWAAKQYDPESSRGYIDNPLVGDRLVPIGEKNSAPYIFTGEIESESELGRVLVFRRSVKVWSKRGE